MAAKGCGSARARRHNLGPPIGRIAAAISERRFIACRLAANARANWQLMHATYIWSIRRSDVVVSNQRHRPSTQGKRHLWEPDRPRQPILVRTLCLRGCGPRAA